MKTKREKRVNQEVRKINKELKTCPYPEYEIRQDCKQRVDGVTYYLYKILNHKTGTVYYIPTWYTDFDVLTMNNLVFEVNRHIGEEYSK